MAYEPQTWVDKTPATPGTRITKARMDHIEQGVKTADEKAEAGGRDGLTVVGGGTVNLPAGEVGDLAGYRVTATTTFTGAGGQVILQPGAYIFEYTSSGWRYRTLDEGTPLTPPEPGSDTTPPTPGTLASSAITTTGFTLTVSGASDNVALHSTPYAFSVDNGSTWSTWQSSPTYNATGAPDTTYTCVHRVRDAATPTPNVTTGTSIPVTTDAPTIIAADTFTRADSTTLGTTEVGSLAWTEAGGDYEIWSGTVKVVGGVANLTRCLAYVDASAADVQVASEIALSPTSVNTGLLLRYVDVDNFVIAHFSGTSNPKVYIQARVAGSMTVRATSTFAATLGQTYTLKAVVSGDNISVLVDDTEVCSATVTEHTTGTRHGLWAYVTAEDYKSRWHDFEVSA